MVEATNSTPAPLVLSSTMHTGLVASRASRRAAAIDLVYQRGIVTQFVVVQRHEPLQNQLA